MNRLGAMFAKAPPSVRPIVLTLYIIHCHGRTGMTTKGLAVTLGQRRNAIQRAATLAHEAGFVVRRTQYRPGPGAPSVWALTPKALAAVHSLGKKSHGKTVESYGRA